jgi:hypothetical protein
VTRVCRTFGRKIVIVRRRTSVRNNTLWDQPGVIVAGLQCVLLKTQKPWSPCVQATARLPVLRSAIHGIRVELLRASLMRVGAREVAKT